MPAMVCSPPLFVRRISAGCPPATLHLIHAPLSPPALVQAELAAELEEELRSFGISPQAEGLTGSQLSEAAAELERRRQESHAAMSPGDRQRYDYMRATVGWHVQRVRGWPGATACATAVPCR